MTLTLITIPASHYCEKARWALDRANLSYVERGSMPLLHWLDTRPRGGASVPFLVTPEGPLKDSTDILKWVDRQHRLYPTDPAQRSEALALEDHFDEVLGPHLRRLVYAYLLPYRDQAQAIVAQGTAAWQVALARPLFPLFAQVLRRALKIDAASVVRSTTKVTGVFGEVSRRLTDGRRYLVGDTFSAADLTFAALSSPVLMPPEHPIHWLDAPPPELAALRDELTATLAGQHVLRMYREHRPRGR